MGVDGYLCVCKHTSENGFYVPYRRSVYTSRKQNVNQFLSFSKLTLSPRPLLISLSGFLDLTRGKRDTRNLTETTRIYLSFDLRLLLLVETVSVTGIVIPDIVVTSGISYKIPLSYICLPLSSFYIF